MTKANLTTILCSLIAYATALHMAIYGPPDSWGWNGGVLHGLYDVFGRNGYMLIFAAIGTGLIVRAFRSTET